MNITATSQAEYIVQYQELIATNYFGVASFVVLLYDHILTFDDEVRYIWRSKKKLVSWLFLLNRYLTPLGFCININAYTSKLWTPLICTHFVRFEGSMTLIGIAIASLMMGLRVIALYHGNQVVPVVMMFLFSAMVGVNAWLLTAGEAVHHPTGIHGCSMIFSHRTGDWSSASAWLPLLYDTVVVGLVMYRTRDLLGIKIAGQHRVVETIMKDGLIYYSVILAANLVLAVMIVKAADGVKNICAQFQLLITVTMMSRITLNLRKNMQRPYTDPVILTNGSALNMASFQRPSTAQTYGTDGRMSWEPLRNSRRSNSSRDLEGYVLDISVQEETQHTVCIRDWEDEY